MPAPSPDSARDDAARRALESFRAGMRSRELALLDTLLALGDLDAVRCFLEGACVHDVAFGPLRDLLLDHWEGCRTSLAIAERAEHLHRAGAPTGGHVADVGALFDAAASISELAGVALYSFGDRELLDRATAEVTAHLQKKLNLDKTASVLDIGCGAGRIEAALTRHVARVIGIDVSEAMIRAARRNTAHFDNVAYFVAGGHDLGAFDDRSFDVVLAIDSIPYLVSGGQQLVGRCVAEVTRVLRPNGQFAICGFSYRADADQDRRDVAALARQNGLDVLEEGTSPFSLWDALYFQLRAACPR